VTIKENQEYMRINVENLIVCHVWGAARNY